jgi:hypothetical protein
MTTDRRRSRAALHNAAGYARLLNTYSDHRSLEPAVRARLLGGIADLIDARFGGRIVKGYLTVRHLARRERP